MMTLLSSLHSVIGLTETVNKSSVPCSAALGNWTPDLWLTAAWDDVTVEGLGVDDTAPPGASRGFSALLEDPETGLKQSVVQGPLQDPEEVLLETRNIFYISNMTFLLNDRM